VGSLLAGVFTGRSRAARSRPATSRRRAIASALNRPCFQAFRLPFGAPRDGPPCIRHRPFGIAGRPGIFVFNSDKDWRKSDTMPLR
jgi:hypothetical protein